MFTVSTGVPVSVDVRGAEGVAVVQQRGVDQHVVLWIIHQILQVAQVTVAASDAVSSAVLVQDEHLTGTEPTLEKRKNTGEMFGIWPANYNIPLICHSKVTFQISIWSLEFFMLNNKQTAGNDLKTKFKCKLEEMRPDRSPLMAEQPSWKITRTPPSQLPVTTGDVNTWTNSAHLLAPQTQ